MSTSDWHIELRHLEQRALNKKLSPGGSKYGTVHLRQSEEHG